MQNDISTLKKSARITGFVYFIFALTAIYGYLIVPKYAGVIPGDAAATAESILANEFIYRTGLLSSLISITLFVVTSLLLHKLLKSVNAFQANLMVSLVLVHVAISFIQVAFRTTALLILKGKILTGADPEELQNLAMVFFRFRESAILIGLWLFPLAYLVYKSGFIPKLFGVLLFLNGLAYTLDSITFVLFPEYRSEVSRFTIYFESFGEPLFILWLMIFGVRVKLPKSEVEGNY